MFKGGVPMGHDFLDDSLVRGPKGRFERENPLVKSGNTYAVWFGPGGSGQGSSAKMSLNRHDINKIIFEGTSEEIFAEIERRSELGEPNRVRQWIEVQPPFLSRG